MYKSREKVLYPLNVLTIIGEISSKHDNDRLPFSEIETYMWTSFKNYL